MKTLKEIKDHFSNEEIKLLIEIVKGRQDFDIMETSIKAFYFDEVDCKENWYQLNKETLIEKLEVDLEKGGII
jgi:hypothetical protein